MEQLMRGLAAESDNEEIPSEDEDVAQDVADRPHARLLDAISSMDGNKRLKHTLRTIHGQNVSEFGFKTQKVDAQTLMSEMMGSLHKTASHSALKKQLKSTYTSAQVVDTPAPKHIKEKIQRSVGYEKAVKEISKWDPVVTANRRAEQLKFPLEQPTQRLLNTHITFTPITALEKEIQAELAKVNPENRIPKGKLFTPKEEEEMKAMSLEEARERRAELMRMRAIMYTKASKLRWQNKIKSKRYRRAKKKEKLKQMEKELEELAVTDPQALMDRMEEVERKRLEERGRLRHMGGGKFARQAKVFSKYDNEKRQQIQDMLAKHKELLKKQQLPSSSDSEDEVDTRDIVSGRVQSKNAWMQPTVPRLISSTGPHNKAREHEDEEEEEEEEMDEEEEKERKFLASFDVEESNEEDSENNSDNDGEVGDVEKEEMAANLSHSVNQTEASVNQENKVHTDKDAENKETDRPDDAQKKSSHQMQGATNALGKKAEKKGNKQMESTHEKETQKLKMPDTKTSYKQEKKQMDVTHAEETPKLQETEGKKTNKKRKQKQKEQLVSENALHLEELKEKQTQEKDTEEYEVVTSQKKKKRAKKQKGTQAQETAQPSQEKSEANGRALLEGNKPTEMHENNVAEFMTAKTKKTKRKNKRKGNNDTLGETAEEKALMAVVKGLRSTDESNDNTESKEDRKSKNNSKPTDANKPTGSKPENASDTLMTIAEAFDDDDVVAEFVEEKRRVEEEEGEKDKDLFVPGWGSWAGAGIVHSKKMRERFIKKAPPQTRTDNQIGHVIISEKKNAAVEKHMLDKVPFPYKDLKQMQTVLSKPIGRDFTSEVQFKKNIKPKVVVNRIGQIIQPINENALLHGGQKRKAVDIELNTKKPEKAGMGKKKKKN